MRTWGMRGTGTELASMEPIVRSSKASKSVRASAHRGLAEGLRERERAASK